MLIILVGQMEEFEVLWDGLDGLGGLHICITEEQIESTNQRLNN